MKIDWKMRYGQKDVKRMCETKNSSLWGKVTLLLVVAAVCWICIAQSAMAGSIIDWGSMKTSNDYLTAVSAIAAGVLFLANDPDLALGNNILICCAAYRPFLRRKR